MRNDVIVRRFRKVPIERRVAAFLIDFGSIALLSTLGGSAAFIPLFIFLWVGLRVLLVVKNQGQSLGRWALDIKVSDAKYTATPLLPELLKRETLVGLGSLMVMIGLANLSPSTGGVVLLFIPLAIDCSFAFADEENQQAFHDRLARTIVAQTQRGYSLDLKVKRLFAQVNRRVK
ncbi:MAG: RDD family protein [Scytolyngbya sp. HA4215-MV1]|jgi:uncharacterized RDD family membrane protein YckC|nr:RDD family protein [Scytolyngbya sp. HA4215-MV1]